MTRREVITGLAGILLVPLAAEAQQVMGAVPRVGVLTPQTSAEPPILHREPFEQGLRELGWKPGTDLLIEYRYAEGSSDRLAELAAEFVRLKVNVIVARGSQATRAARAKTGTIPIVMAVVSDPVANGFASTLMRPGGNVTGLSFLASGDFEAKQMEMLKEALPGLTRVAILTNPLTWPDPAGLLMRDVRVAAGSLGLEIEAFMVRAPSELPEAFAAITRAHMGALLVRTDPQILEPHRDQVVALAQEHRLPAIYPWQLYSEAGGLMSYGARLFDLHRRSAAYVDKILKGAAPGELPIEQPVQFRFIINGRVARDLGLMLPQSLLARADEVTE